MQVPQVSLGACQPKGDRAAGRKQVAWLPPRLVLGSFFIRILCSISDRTDEGDGVDIHVVGHMLDTNTELLIQECSLPDTSGGLAKDVGCILVHCNSPASPFPHPSLVQIIYCIPCLSIVRCRHGHKAQRRA